MMCIHCHRRKQNGGRPLCWTCWHDGAIRKLYPRKTGRPAGIEEPTEREHVPPEIAALYRQLLTDKATCPRCKTAYDTHPRCIRCTVYVGERHVATRLIDGVCVDCHRSAQIRRQVQAKQPIHIDPLRKEAA